MDSNYKIESLEREIAELQRKTRDLDSELSNFRRRIYFALFYAGQIAFLVFVIFMAGRK